MNKLGREVMQWLEEKAIREPPKGWRSIKWIAEKKNVSEFTVRRQVEKFVKAGKIPPPITVSEGHSLVRYYFVGS